MPKDRFGRTLLPKRGTTVDRSPGRRTTGIGLTGAARGGVVSSGNRTSFRFLGPQNGAFTGEVGGKITRKPAAGGPLRKRLTTLKLRSPMRLSLLRRRR